MTFTPEIEPMLPSDARINRSILPDLVVDLERKAAVLSGMMSPMTAQVIEEYMRVINSYYSNLIEGNRTHPREIRQAMAGHYSQDPAKRDLQREALAHIEVQKLLLHDPLASERLLKPECIKSIHRMFFERIPESLRAIRSEDGVENWVVPGQFRLAGEEVAVGQHLAPPSEDIDRLLARFQEVYRLDRLRGYMPVIAAMAAHHRLTWIHPFMDGNGRVGRLHTDLFLKAVGVGAYGTWCISRGLARANEDYKFALARADFPRQGAADGRGALSEGALVDFCEFMIRTAIDQVEYMTSILNLQGMGQRMSAYVEDRNRGLVLGLPKIKPETIRILEKAFMYGEFPRAEMEAISGLGASVTRKLVQQMKEEGLLSETSSRSPLRWAIPEHAERYYFPELAPT